MLIPPAATTRKLELSLTAIHTPPRAAQLSSFLLFSDVKSGRRPSSLGSQCHGYKGGGHHSSATLNRNWWDAVAALPGCQSWGRICVFLQAYSSPVPVNCLAGGSLVLHVSIGVETD